MLGLVILPAAVFPLSMIYIAAGSTRVPPRIMHFMRKRSPGLPAGRMQLDADRDPIQSMETEPTSSRELASAPAYLQTLRFNGENADKSRLRGGFRICRCACESRQTVALPPFNLMTDNKAA